MPTPSFAAGALAEAAVLTHESENGAHQRFRFLYLLLVLLLVTGAGRTAVAQSAGLAESAQPFSVVRDERTVQFPAGEGHIIRTGDQLVAGNSAVMVRNDNGRSVLVDATSAAGFPTEGFVEVLKGQVAVAFPAEFPTQVTYKDLSFIPLGAKAEDRAVPAQLAVRVNSESEVQVISYNDAFAAMAGSEDPVQLAVVGDSDVARFMRPENAQWQYIRIQNNNVSQVDPNNPSQTLSDNGCNCDSQLRFNDAQGGLSGATFGTGNISCRADASDPVITPGTPGGGFSGSIPSALVKCGSKVELPVSIAGAGDISDFTITLVYHI